MHSLSHIRRIETLKRRFAPELAVIRLRPSPRSSATTGTNPSQGTKPSQGRSPLYVTSWMGRYRPSSPASERPTSGWTPGWPCAGTWNAASTTRSARNPATSWAARCHGPRSEAYYTHPFGTAPLRRSRRRPRPAEACHPEPSEESRPHLSEPVILAQAGIQTRPTLALRTCGGAATPTPFAIPAQFVC